MKKTAEEMNKVLEEVFGNTEYKGIPGYESYYINNTGEIIFNTKTLKVLKQTDDLRGYLRVVLCKDGKCKTIKVHKLMEMAFMDKPKQKGICVNHIDGNKHNNNINNLEQITPSENVKHSLYVLGKNTSWVSMIDKETGKIIKTFTSIMNAERETDIYRGSICKCCKGNLKTAGGYKWEYAVKMNNTEDEVEKYRRSRV